MDKIFYIFFLAFLYLLSSCHDYSVDPCDRIRISKNSDQDKYKSCNKAAVVHVYNDTTKIDKLNKLTEVEYAISFSDPEDEEEHSNWAYIQSITGFQKLKKIGYLDYLIDSNDSEFDVLKEFNSLHSLEETGSINIDCTNEAKSDDFLSDFGECGPSQLIKLDGFGKLTKANGISIAGASLEEIPDFNEITELTVLTLNLPAIKKLPKFKSLKHVTYFEVAFGCHFTKAELEANFAHVKVGFDDSSPEVFRVCTE